VELWYNKDMNGSDFSRLYYEYGNITTRDLFTLRNVFDNAYREFGLYDKNKFNLSIYSAMAKLGNEKIAENGKFFGKVYEVRYTVKSFSYEFRDTMLVCLASLAELNQVDSGYVVRFDFDDAGDMGYFLMYSNAITDVLKEGTKLINIDAYLKLGV
jgi:hypothetical protein